MTSGGDSDDKVVVDAAELAPVGKLRSPRAGDRRDATPVPLGRGTRDQPVFSIDDLPDDLSRELRLELPELEPGFDPDLEPTRTEPALELPRRESPLPEPRVARVMTPPVVPRPALPPIPPLPPIAVVDPPPRSRPRSTRDFDHSRDPAEVFRMWPHSLRGADDPAAPVAPAAPAASSSVRAIAPAPVVPRRIEDKVELAHLALELYRELEADVQGAHVVHTGACSNQACEARVNALRGGLVEACLLVQRVAMLTPVAKGTLEDHVRDLLTLLAR